MKRIIFYLLFSCYIPISLVAQTHILIITGGHDFEKEAFFEVFNSIPNLDYDTLVQPAGNERIKNQDVNTYDALVFYDMFQEISESQKAAYLKLLTGGKGMIFLHHSLVSYQDWPEFQNIIGGKYLLNETDGHPKSTYRHDVDIDVQIINPSHPVTKSMKNFKIHDEVYGSYLVNDDVKPLLKTDHPESTEVVGWCHIYKGSKIVYFQQGHDHLAYENEQFRKLLENAIKWVSTNDSH